MAKKLKKVRNKKPASAANRRQRQIYSAVTDTFKRLWFSGSSVTKGVKTHNLRRIGALLEARDATIGEGLLLDKIRNEECTWYFWIGVFCDDGDEVWCEPVAGQSADCHVRDFDAIVTPLIKAAVDNVDSVHAKGYGWVATPTYNCDLVATEENFIKMFMDADVTNEDKRRAIFEEHQTGIEASAISGKSGRLLDMAEEVAAVLKDTNCTVDEAIEAVA